MPDGTCEYRLVVDGQWIADPLAKETVLNPFGGRNSVLNVASSPEAAHRADAETLPLINVNRQTADQLLTRIPKSACCCRPVAPLPFSLVERG